MKYKKLITSVIPIIVSIACLYVFYSEVDSFNNFFSEIKNQTKIITTDKMSLKKAKLENNAEVFGCLAYSLTQHSGL